MLTHMFYVRKHNNRNTLILRSKTNLFYYLLLRSAQRFYFQIKYSYLLCIRDAGRLLSKCTNYATTIKGQLCQTKLQIYI